VQRICVDMDEVMADTLAEHIRRYNQTFDEDVTPSDLAGKGLWEITPLDRQQQLRAFLDAEDFFENLDLMPGAQDVLQQLSTRFAVFIATQAMAVPNSLGSKYRWLQRHFPFIPPTNYVFCGDKSILRADYLIDDLPKNILRFQGQGLLYSAPHNLAATGFLRVDNWQQVAEYFLGLEVDLQRKLAEAAFVVGATVVADTALGSGHIEGRAGIITGFL
jgi:5'-nucleotidase